VEYVRSSSMGWNELKEMTVSNMTPRTARIDELIVGGADTNVLLSPALYEASRRAVVAGGHAQQTAQDGRLCGHAGDAGAVDLVSFLMHSIAVVAGG
jgi:hypothetical protein